MRQRQFTIIPRQLMKANDLRRVISIITLAMMMALALPPDSSARSSGSHSTSHRSSSAGYSHAARTPSTGKAAPSSASDRALSRQTSKGTLTALRAADAARKASTAVVLPPSSQSRRPSTTHHRSRGLFDRVDLDLDDVVEAVVPLFTTRAPTVVVVNNAPNAATTAAVPIAAATTAAVAAAPAAAAPTATSIAASAGSVLSAIVTGLIMLLLIRGFIGAVVLWWLWRRRSRNPGTESNAAARPSARSHLFRVGMTLPVDPSLFILAAPYTTVTAPEAATASGFLSVEQVGRVEGSGQTWYRLYVASGTGFFQVHLDAAGQPDECRYFSQLDEVAPADAEEWRIWLDQADGLLGRPTFATKDGQHYQRHWSPGTTRIAPHPLTETLEPGGAQRHEQAMLYARLTAAPPPAPPTEYLLVQAIEQPDAAWIALQVGIDIPLAALQLS